MTTVSILVCFIHSFSPEEYLKPQKNTVHMLPATWEIRDEALA
jgi:hypothetical protein